MAYSFKLHARHAPAPGRHHPRLPAYISYARGDGNDQFAQRIPALN
jgi:hypothetical protein